MSIVGVPAVVSGPTHLDLPESDAPRRVPTDPADWPTHLDLPETDGKPVENTFEHPQAALLSDVLGPVLRGLHPDGNYLVGAGSGIYWYNAKPDPLDGCKAPDWFYVPNVPPLLDGEPRRSYVHYRERANPLLVVEFVSGNGNDERDREPVTGKFWVYEHAIAATFYLIWDTPRGEFEVYELVRGGYQRLAPDEHGRVFVRDMGVAFGVWRGEYHNCTLDWLRAWDRDGNLLPTAADRAEVEKGRAEDERKRAEAEKQRAEAEKQRAEKFAARLRELGVDPDTV